MTRAQDVLNVYVEARIKSKSVGVNRLSHYRRSTIRNVPAFGWLGSA